jgi:lysophospholipase L1-like esterase
MVERAPIRLCFIGDSIVNGYGDDAMLGWPGRLCALLAPSWQITRYDLGIRGDTSALIRSRWEAEARARLPAGFPAALVFSFGVNDCVRLNGVRRVEPADSLANLAAICGAARIWLPTLFIGPTPILSRADDRAALSGPALALDNDTIGALSGALLAHATELGIATIDLFGPLRQDAAWVQALAKGDGIHPPAEGYQLLAQRIAAAPAWRDLLARAGDARP